MALGLRSDKKSPQKGGGALLYAELLTSPRDVMRFAVRSHLVSAILHRLTRRLRLEPEAVTATHASIGRTRKSRLGEINIPHDQQGAIAAIDARELASLIEQGIREERSRDFHRVTIAKKTDA